MDVHGYGVAFSVETPEEMFHTRGHVAVRTGEVRIPRVYGTKKLTPTSGRAPFDEHEETAEKETCVVAHIEETVKGTVEVVARLGKIVPSYTKTDIGTG